MKMTELMRNTVAAAVVAFASAAVADEPVLLWLVSDPVISDGSGKTDAESIWASAVRIRASNGSQSDYLTYWYDDDEGKMVDTPAETIYGLSRENEHSPLEAGPTWSNLHGEYGDYTENGWSFTMELVNYEDGNWMTVASSDPVSYQDLVSGKHVSAGQLDLPSTVPWRPEFSTASVPEPTSGMMLLIGTALLALRRRRKA